MKNKKYVKACATVSAVQFMGIVLVFIGHGLICGFTNLAIKLSALLITFPLLMFETNTLHRIMMGVLNEEN